jgi:hypothetical protein
MLLTHSDCNGLAAHTDSIVTSSFHELDDPWKRDLFHVEKRHAVLADFALAGRDGTPTRSARHVFPAVAARPHDRFDNNEDGRKVVDLSLFLIVIVRLWL